MRHRGYKTAIHKYNAAIEAAKDIPDVLGPAYLNRAMAEYKLGNCGRALKDVEHCLRLTPSNIKAHYRYVSERSATMQYSLLTFDTYTLKRAILCAMILEKHDVANRHIKQGLELSKGNAGDTHLFQTQRKIVEAKIEKQRRMNEARKSRESERQKERDSVAVMMEKRRIKCGAPLFAQQRRYTTSKAYREQGEWLWPVLLIYPDEVVECEMGDQSDYLEGVSEQVCMDEMIRQVFEYRPEWDVNRRYASVETLEVRYRRRWTRSIEELDEDSEDFCGSCLGQDEVGDWVSVQGNVTLGEVLERKDYIIPFFPVLYVVPKGVRLR